MTGDRLDIDDVDIESLILARNDAHPAGDWWFDPRTGETLYFGIDDDEDLPQLVQGGQVMIPREPQPREDVDDFLSSDALASIGPDVVVRLLEAYRGRGGLRRFREVVSRTEAADAWARFTLQRESVRAIDWLLGRDLVDPGSASRRRHALVGDDIG